MKTRSFYFAHPITMYDSGSERQISDRFRQRFPDVEVENPNQQHHSDGYKKGGMDYFVDLCNTQDGVFFATHSDGTVGAGVYKEVKSFLDRGAPAFYFDPEQLAFQGLSGPAALGAFAIRDVPSTRALIKEERAAKAAGQDPFATLETFTESAVQ
jgi:hypothetical protein